MQAAYYALHYGCDYLPWSIRSIQDAVHEIHIFYVDRPSYGHSQGASCPDTRDALRAAAFGATDKPLHWHEGLSFHNEGQHRNHAMRTLKARGAHQVLVVDADEIWLPGAAKAAIDAATKANRTGNWMARFVHFIRSTKYVVKDHFTPVRVIDLRHGGSEVLPEGLEPVMHFGYAQNEALIRYKWTCHGHQDELRPGWMDRFMNWTPETEDLHPVVNDLWRKAEPLDPELTKKLAVSLKGHPYLEMDVIR